MSGELLSWMLYSKPPIFWVPTGVIRFCAASALATSCPDSPRACSAGGLRSIWIWRCLPPIRIGDRGARHRDQRRAQLVDADIGEVLLGEAFARQRDLDDRHGGGVVVEDQRRRRAGRHLLEQRLRDRGDLGVGGADIDIRLEEDLDDAEAVIGIGDDMLDVVDRRRQRALERRDDAAGHLVRRQAGILPDHADHGDADVGKDVGRRAQRRERSDDQEQQREHDEGVRPAQRDADQCNHKTGIPRQMERRGPAAQRANSFALIYPNRGKIANDRAQLPPSLPRLSAA